MAKRTGQTRVAPSAVALARIARWAPASVHDVLATLWEKGGEAVLVGGAVRDAFLGRRSHDWDVATSLPPAVVAGAFFRVVRAGEKHGTIMVITADGPIEVTTFRSEGAYLDARRPSVVEFHGDLHADLARRDFTINALAADLRAHRIVDPFGGVDDLSARIVRCVGDPVERFAEDGLRPLRAVRFAAVLDLSLDPATRAAIPTALGSFERVSWERKRDEMTRLLAQGTRFARIRDELAATGLLDRLAPELAPAAADRLVALDELPGGAPWLRLAAWAVLAGAGPQAAGALLRRWRVALVEVRRAEGWIAAVALLGDRPRAGAELRRWLARAGAAFAPGAARIAEAVRGAEYRGFYHDVMVVLGRRPVLSTDRLAVLGDDLVELGITGPRVGETLRALLEAVLDEPRRNRKSTLMAIAHRLSTGPGSARAHGAGEEKR